MLRKSLGQVARQSNVKNFELYWIEEYVNPR